MHVPSLVQVKLICNFSRELFIVYKSSTQSLNLSSVATAEEMEKELVAARPIYLRAFLINRQVHAFECNLTPIYIILTWFNNR